MTREPNGSRIDGPDAGPDASARRIQATDTCAVHAGIG